MVFVDGNTMKQPWCMCSINRLHPMLLDSFQLLPTVLTWVQNGEVCLRVDSYGCVAWNCGGWWWQHLVIVLASIPCEFFICVFILMVRKDQKGGKLGSQSEAPDWTSRQPTSDLWGNPPLSTTHLNEEVRQKYKVVIKRHEQTVGLIGAKQTGGDAATGDIIVFFDCHVGHLSTFHELCCAVPMENVVSSASSRLRILVADDGTDYLQTYII